MADKFETLTHSWPFTSFRTWTKTQASQTGQRIDQAVSIGIVVVDMRRDPQ